YIQKKVILNTPVYIFRNLSIPLFNTSLQWLFFIQFNKIDSFTPKTKLNVKLVKQINKQTRIFVTKH
ncbi:hypothetical protein DUE01_18805, partial [Salmonella enterica subsp. enterica]|nr:hypothetical protein [Salmonella enterica subsp. enterica]